MKNLLIKTILISLIILVCGIATYLSSPKKEYYPKVPKIDPNAYYEVHKVLDGDTFEILLEGKIATVRMLGIDTPETLDPRKPIQCFGVEASNTSKNLLEKKTVRLENDSTQRKGDKYGRILAYVYRQDGLFLNEYLLEHGYAREYTYDTSYKKQEAFKAIEKRVKKEKIGLWGSPCNGKLTAP